MEKKMNKKNKGFTIFEILIVVGIIILLSGLTVTYYNNYSENEKLSGEAKKINSVFDLALKKTQAAEWTSEEEGCLPSFIGYQITISDTNQFALERLCSGPATIIKTYYLQNNIKIVQPEVGTTMLYRKLSKTILLNYNEIIEPIELIIKNEALNNNNCLKITINQAGVINIGEKTNCEDFE